MSYSHSSSNLIHLFVIRHGERIDHIDPFWIKQSPKPYDPHLSDKGHKQAYQTGVYLLDQFKVSPINSNKDENNYKVVLFCSPFLRCIQTSLNIINNLKDNNNIKLNVEPGLCEWHTDEYYDESVPDSLIAHLTTNSAYKDQINTDYKPFYVKLPKYPESYEELEERGRKMASYITSWALSLNRKLNSLNENSNHVLNVVLVSHGATVGSLVAALTNSRIKSGVDYCSVSKLKLVFQDNTESWILEGKYQDNSHLDKINNDTHTKDKL